jgi:methylenetetrahydrofolate dehydrogenase (NADP+) / methenyltetrahydrofolate cyclohydrolase
MKLIEGKVVAAAVEDSLRSEIASLRDQHGAVPGIAVVIVGEDPASQVYVRNKVKQAGNLGVYSEKHELPADATQSQVEDLVRRLNDSSAVHGILVQSPPPPQIDERAVVEAIHPDKDVDCFHPYNVGKLLIGDQDGFMPCTPQGIVELLTYYRIETTGRHAVVIGRSNIVGKPVSVLLSRKGPAADCTVTICHSRTSDLRGICAQADILVSAIGRPRFVTADMVKDGAVVIDVGINRIPDATRKSGTRLVGDVDFDTVAPKTSYITPVPGGVGPMTIMMLMRNTVKACRKQCGLAA